MNTDTLNTATAAATDVNKAGVNLITWFQNLITRHAVELGIALVILVIGLILARWVRNLMKKAFVKMRMDSKPAGFLSKLVYVFLVMVLLLNFFSMLGMPMASFMAIMGTIVLAVGIALKDDLSQAASGILIFIFRPYRLGDYVIMGSYSGTVVEITFFTTKLLSLEGNLHIVPNNKMTSEVVTNVTARPERRLNFTIPVSMDANLDQVKAIIGEVFQQEDRILQEKDLVIAVKSWERNQVQLTVMAWVLQKDYWDVHYSTLEALIRRFQEEKVPMASDLWTHQKRTEKQV